MGYPPWEPTSRQCKAFWPEETPRPKNGRGAERGHHYQTQEESPPPHHEEENHHAREDPTSIPQPHQATDLLQEERAHHQHQEETGILSFFDLKTDIIQFHQVLSNLQINSI